ncbi:Chitinase, GH18 family [Sinomicrobium oceani]|uniref:chitinase n=1 Tax=Sinomicrobium oceani TaxID=1150368 RepID=A0A1K1NP11_9FLAO|nr:glycosyl hydrolase family 18 protein [Sinomicrobium oceani]SFW37009.1 Chitinase, GH18 family [Sinomicrobium oceani]
MKKNWLYIIPVVALLLLASGCSSSDDDGYSTDFFPRIFDPTNVFSIPSYVINVGDEVTFENLAFSPGGVVDISWKINGEEVSKEESYTFTATEGGEFELVLEVKNGEDTVTRNTFILVSPENYEFKPYTAVVMPYLSDQGSSESINWDIVTHIAFKCGRVLPGGDLEVIAGENAQTADALVARSHLNGIPVLMGISGRLSGIDGWALYESNDFGNVIRDPQTRDILIENIVSYVSEKKMDGVDIMMTDLNSGLASSNAAAVGPFITALKSALPEGSLVTVTVATNWVHSEYTDLSDADWLNVRAFENGAHVGPGAPPGQSSPLSYMVQGANLWVNQHNIPANKIVLGIPAFGVRYDQLDENGNNASWGSYAYMRYNDILAEDPDAATQEYSDIAFGVYYNGIPLVEEKATYIRDNQFLGAYIWAGDYDAAGANSLTGTLYNILN